MKFFETYTVLFAVLAVVVGACPDDSDGVSVEAEENSEVVQDLEEFPAVRCEAHEEYSECTGDSTCQKTCENMDHWETMTCARTKICIRGCVCEEGFVRDDYNGVCVQENSCPRVKH